MKNSTISFILMLLVSALVGSILGEFLEEELYYTNLEVVITCGGAGGLIGLFWPKFKHEQV